MKNIAVFASGSGSNAENLVNYFKNHQKARVVMMVCDRKNAFVFERMKKSNTPSYYMTRQDFESGTVLNLLNENKIDFIVLAGFLRLVPESIIKTYTHRIINIHPALLPSYGGKGMYGSHVHEAIMKAGESKTGITIHYVNEHFDEGEIIEQYETTINRDDTPDSIAAKVHDLEMKYFPKVIEKIISQN